MEIEMESPPKSYDPEDLSTRAQFRRYGKRNSSLSPQRGVPSSKLRESRLLYDGQNIHSPTNAALLLENIKHEAEGLDSDYLQWTSPKNNTRSATSSKRRSYMDQHHHHHGVLSLDFGGESVRSHESYSLKACKVEEESFLLSDSEETTFALFASLLDSGLQGLMNIPDLILRFERSCRNVSESIRYSFNLRHRVIEDKLMRQKAQFLLDEAASWSLLWYMYGKEHEEFPKDLILSPSTSHLEACHFVAKDHTAQLCLRLVQWLEELASKSLELQRKVRGSHVGTYLPSSGIWHNTQRLLKRGSSNTNIVHHLDFDATTREHANQLPDDRKQDESLLEDVWTLIRAGRLEEACNLCRSAGQPWRAASLCPFGGMDLFPSLESLAKNGKNRTLQAIELESGIAHQWRLWKWACYRASEKIAEQDGLKYETAVYAAQCSNIRRMLPICTDWESACWAMAKSWLNVQIDMELSHLQPGGSDQYKCYEDIIDGNNRRSEGSAEESKGPESWPQPILNQQPRQLSALLQKLHSNDTVHEAVIRECKEQQRQIQMYLMSGNIPNLLELIWSWVAPAEGDEDISRPHGDPQMIRFGAHLVLVLRYLLTDEMTDAIKEKILTVGDLILQIYAMFLFSKQHEELVGIYASNLARHRCIDLFVHMMELRLNSSVHVKYKIFLAAIEYLPFSPDDDLKGSFEEIIERVLSRSREIKPGKYDESTDVAEQHRLQSLQKAMAVQWLCFTPPSTVTDVKDICTKLLLRALVHSNILFREFALISMWRTPEMPIGAHTLLSFLAEPLKQIPDSVQSFQDYNVAENVKEFQDWNEYYSCDATYRKWLKIELENAEIPSTEISLEERERAISAATEMIDSSLLLLKGKEAHWLTSSVDLVYETTEPIYLELHATAMLCLSSGECVCPDPTLCAALMSALYSSVSEDIVLRRQLMVNVAISSRDNYCIEVVLRCLAVEGDGLGSQAQQDGGLLATVIAAGFKGELARFQAGVTMDISRLDAWYSNKDGPLEGPATFIVQGLCRRCCLPEVILRCMQVSVSMIELGCPTEAHDELVELVACSETGLIHLFSQQQLQEFMFFEREYSIGKMNLKEGLNF